MATRTQIQLDVTTGCVHEQLCQAMYEQQYRRIHSLCQWMTPDPAAARALAQSVFLDACEQAGAGWPAVSGDQLAASLALRFRNQIHAVAAGDKWRGSAWRQSPSRSRAATPVRAAVNALPPTLRLLYLLHELEGYSPATLGDWLGLEPEHCARMIHSARLQLRRDLRAA